MTAPWIWRFRCAKSFTNVPCAYQCPLIALAERAELPAVYARLVERKRRKPTLHVATRLLEGLGELSKLVSEAEQAVKGRT